MLPRRSFTAALGAAALASTSAAAWLVLGRDGFAQEAASKSGPAPEFESVKEWINSEPLKMADLRGQVVVVHFYAFGCINCIRNLPHYNAWQKDFAGKPVTIIGLQTPETDDERKLDRVREKAKEYEMTHAIGFDADSKMWQAWGNDLWPTVYLIDKKGLVRYRWRGELEWRGDDGKSPSTGGEAKMRKKIEELLAEKYTPPREAKTSKDSKSPSE